MKGLILKDFYILTKQLKIVLIFIAVFALIPQLSATSFALVYVSMIPLTVLAYDERSKWEKIALTMPYTRSQLVISKYILGLLSTTVTALLILIGNFINTKSLLSVPELKETLLIFCFSMIIMSLLLPVLFKFGVEKGRLLFILVAVLFSVAFIYLSSETTPDLGKFTYFIEHYFYLVPAITVVVLILSVLISLSIYIKKSF